MARHEQRRPRPPRRFRARWDLTSSPHDEMTGFPTPPQHLALQRGLEGNLLWRDTRRGSGSFDAPGYVGTLEDPEFYERDPDVLEEYT